MGFSIFCDDSAGIYNNPGYSGFCVGPRDGYWTEDAGRTPEQYVQFRFSTIPGQWRLIGRSDGAGNGPFTDNPGTESGTLHFKAPQTGYFVVWLQGVENENNNAWHSLYLFNGGTDGISDVEYDTNGVTMRTGEAGPALAFAALFSPNAPPAGAAGPALALGYTVRIAPSLAPTEAIALQFDFWLPDALNGASLAAPTSPHHALDLLMQPTAPGTWATAVGMTISAVSVVASGVADPSAAAAGLPTPAGVAGTHYRVEANYQAGAAAATWPMLIGSAAVDDPATDNPWPAGALDRSVAAFGLRVTGVAVDGQAHRRAIVNV